MIVYPKHIGQGPEITANGWVGIAAMGSFVIMLGGVSAPPSMGAVVFSFVGLGGGVILGGIALVMWVLNCLQQDRDWLKVVETAGWRYEMNRTTPTVRRAVFVGGADAFPRSFPINRRWIEGEAKTFNQADVLYETY